ncbi:hypothetical protein GGR54DRAFT_395768 [Hypoxylon sp. NC1633]|nr:hypothetical protein GGR54DRAFT_395768 [Hypoxylon sp. NC1633]
MQTVKGIASRSEMIIGLDIGVTYSKMAYWTPECDDAETCFFRHSTNISASSHVVPTVLYYEDQDHKTPVGWGHDVVPGAKQLRLFKYSLLHEDDWHHDTKDWSVLVDSIKARKQLQKKAVDVMVDYINKLWEACQPQIKPVLNELLDDYGTCSLKFVMTYPKGWQPHQFQEVFNKSILSRLAHDSTMTLLTEAEAAAYFVLDSLENRTAARIPWQDASHSVDLKIGDHIMVVDCGGLTVDTVCGAIDSENGTLVFRTITTPDSALCGASLMTDSFINNLEGKAKMLLTDISALGTEFREDAVRRWETEIMPYMKPTAIETLALSLPTASRQAVTTKASQTHSRWLKAGKIPIYAAEISSIFDFAIDHIVELIHTQMEQLSNETGRHPKYIFFTGGFACNSYLRAAIKNRLQDIPFVFLTPKESRMAVACGAAKYGAKMLRSLSPRLAVLQDEYAIEGNGCLVRLISKEEGIPDNFSKYVWLPYEVIESSFVGGDYKVQLRVCQITDVVKLVETITWWPREIVRPMDDVVLEMRFENEGKVAKTVVWHQGQPLSTQHETTPLS